MIVIAAVILGAALGVRAARRRNGTRADQIQYAAGFAIAFGLVALFATIAIERTF